MKLIKALLSILVTAAVILAGVLVPDRLIGQRMKNSVGTAGQVNTSNLQPMEGYAAGHANLITLLELKRQITQGEAKAKGFIGMGTELRDKYNYGLDKMRLVMNSLNWRYLSYIDTYTDRKYYVTGETKRIARVEFMSSGHDVTGTIIFDMNTGLPLEVDYWFNDNGTGDRVPEIQWDYFTGVYSSYSSIVFTPSNIVETNGNITCYTALNYDATLRLTCFVVKDEEEDADRHVRIFLS